MRHLGCGAQCGTSDRRWTRPRALIALILCSVPARPVRLSEVKSESWRCQRLWTSCGWTSSSLSPSGQQPNMSRCMRLKMIIPSSGKAGVIKGDKYQSGRRCKLTASCCLPRACKVMEVHRGQVLVIRITLSGLPKFIQHLCNIGGDGHALYVSYANRAMTGRPLSSTNSTPSLQNPQAVSCASHVSGKTSQANQQRKVLSVMCAEVRLSSWSTP